MLRRPPVVCRYTSPRLVLGAGSSVMSKSRLRSYSEAIERQIERFAPGFRERVQRQVARTVAEAEKYDANYIGGDVVGGANDLRQLLFRPRPARDPYALGIPGVYLCSASTPPGAGAHGMCGFNAANSALRELRRR